MLRDDTVDLDIFEQCLDIIGTVDAETERAFKTTKPCIEIELEAVKQEYKELDALLTAHCGFKDVPDELKEFLYNNSENDQQYGLIMKTMVSLNGAISKLAALQDAETRNVHVNFTSFSQFLNDRSSYIRHLQNNSHNSVDGLGIVNQLWLPTAPCKFTGLPKQIQLLCAQHGIHPLHCFIMQDAIVRALAMLKGEIPDRSTIYRLFTLAVPKDHIDVVYDLVLRCLV